MRTFLNAARKAAKDETGAVNWFAVLAILVVALLVVLVLGQLGYIGPERSATVEIPEGAITVNVEVPTPEGPEVLCDLNGLCRQVGENTEDIEELMAPCDPLFADFEGELWLLAVDEDGNEVRIPVSREECEGHLVGDDPVTTTSSTTTTTHAPPSPPPTSAAVTAPNPTDAAPPTPTPPPPPPSPPTTSAAITTTTTTAATTTTQATTTTSTTQPAANLKPIADARGGGTFFVPDNGDPVQVTLNGSHSDDLDGDVVAYDWTLSSGSGSGAVPSDVSNPTVTLAQGQYTYCLAVRDDDGAWSTNESCVTVTIGAQGGGG